MNKNIGLLLIFLWVPLISRADLPANYQSLNAVQKQDILWTNIVNSEYSSLPVEDSFFSKLALSNPIYLIKSFINSSDELPEGRKKLIHAYGSTAKISLKITNPKYLGIFKTGGIGIARLSIAQKWNADTAFTPGMAIKLLVDGEPSINLHVMNSVDGQGTNHDFLSCAFSNVLPPAKTILGQMITGSFNRAVRLLNTIMNNKGPIDADHLPLLQACRVVAPNTLCPSQIIFRPIADFGGSGLEDDFRKDLAKIPPGTVLYYLKAVGVPGENEELIGQLVTESRFVASDYGDKKLFFSHASLGQ